MLRFLAKTSATTASALVLLLTLLISDSTYAQDKEKARSASDVRRIAPLKTAEVRADLRDYRDSVKKLKRQYISDQKEVDEKYITEREKLKQKVLEKLELAKKAATKAEDLDGALRIRAQSKEIEKEPVTPAGREKLDGVGIRKLKAEIARLKAEKTRLKSKIAHQKKTKILIPKESLAWNGHHYLRVEAAVTWHIATLYAQQLGGHLTRIESQEENLLIGKLIRNGSNNYYSIDGSDELKEGKFLYRNGAPVKFLDWDKGEPTGVRLPYPSHELLIRRFSGKMHDGVCGTRQGYIIEWDK